MGRFRELLSAAGVAAVVVLIGAAIATLDPMGLDAAADRHSAAVVSRMTAPFYARGLFSQDPPLAQGRITVVEVGDETLRQTGEAWPPSRGFYSEMLGILAAGRPKAIFLDYIFLSDLRDREGHDKFIAKLAEITHARDWEDRPSCRESPTAKIGCIVAAGGTPVIIGKPFPPDLCAAGQGDDIAALARLDQAAVVVPLGWPGAPDEARPILTRDYYRGQLGGGRHCPLIERTNPTDPKVMAQLAPFTSPSGLPLTWSGGRDYDLAPATALLVALCRGDPEFAARTAACREKLDGIWYGPEVMSVVWGSVAKPAFLDFRARLYPEGAAKRDGPCEKESRWRLLELGWLQFSSAIGENQAASKVPCPYHPTFDYGVVRAEILDGSDVGQEIRRDYLRGHVVLVGAAMVASTDWIDSVVHGRLAGVHYHAMMLDNLIEKGPDVLQAPPEVFTGGPLAKLHLDWGELLEFFAAFLVVLMVEIGRRRLAGREKPDGRGLLWIAIIFGWAAIVLAGATAVTIAKHWVPVNIIGLFGLTVMDVIASFWSLEGAAWLIGAGLGSRSRLGRGVTRVLFWLASVAAILFSAFRKRPRPSQPEGGPAAPVLRPEEDPPHA